ncbi:hypothetical protein [Cryptosporangium aurantiacum]|uniref:Uncharacterized protein n=1 Tax=Cryptosporangium aurantiacum TaxID=134849 RepID=A0A1M7RJK5_9ACTN|nr:hypothetical protein [Cryptosporangium aurantiacum]SHN46349.1 hypothetical protein SAMN05443668_11535 [Cryptosporangium aurantiacum]
MAESNGPPVPPTDALLRPGERLGWIFRDRNLFRRPFGQPPPTMGEVPADVLASARAANPHLVRNIAIAVPAAVVLSFILVCGLALGSGGDGGGRIFLLMLIVVALVFGGAGALVWLGAQRARSVASRPNAVAAEQRARFDSELADWSRRKAEFDAAEQQRSEQLPEWSPAIPPPHTRRIDVVGGTLWGWEGLLTVFGSSTLASGGRLTVLDLTGEGVCRELAELAAEAGFSTDVQLFPADLPTADVLAGLDQRQFVDVLVEAVHGGDDAGGTDRYGRAADDRVLGAVCAVLAPSGLTVARVLAALRALLGEPAGGDDGLSDAERRSIATELFSPDYRREIGPRLRQLESLLHPLAPLGTVAQPRPVAQLACVAMLSTGSTARDEVLGDLIVQRLTRGAAEADQSGGGSPRTIVVVGADEIARRHLERLSDVCERRGVRLVYLFRHLRGTSLQVLGAGAVGVMRLGNHQEATEAAEFIGRQQRFVLTQLTHQLGGAETHSTGESETRTRASAGMPSMRRPWQALSGMVGSSSRSWRTTAGHAEGTNWNNAEMYQRASEFAVEPRTLQGLPDYAMLLVTAGQHGPAITAVECNPDIVSLPRVSTEPLPPGAAGIPGFVNQPSAMLPQPQPGAAPSHPQSGQPYPGRMPPPGPPNSFPPGPSVR